MNNIEKSAPGLFFAGHFRDGIALGDSIVAGDNVADRIRLFLVERVSDRVEMAAENSCNCARVEKTSPGNCNARRPTKKISLPERGDSSRLHFTEKHTP